MKKKGKINSSRRFYKTFKKTKSAKKVARPPVPENPVICKKYDKEEYDLEKEE